MMDSKRQIYIESLLCTANTFIGLAKLALMEGDAEKAAHRLNQYTEEHDRLEVNYLGLETAEKLLNSGIIHPTKAFREEIEVLKKKASVS